MSILTQLCTVAEKAVASKCGQQKTFLELWKQKNICNMIVMCGAVFCAFLILSVLHFYRKLSIFVNMHGIFFLMLVLPL